MPNYKLSLIAFLAFSILFFSFDKIKKKKSTLKNATTNLPSSNQRVTKGNYYIIVDKNDTTLKVYDDQGWYATYPVAFGGNNLGDKEVENDRKTPDGKFKIRERKYNPNWGMELLLDYPTEESIRNFNDKKKKGLIDADAKIGCCIAIHGTPEGKDWLIDYKQGWTDGCISLKNKDMLELYSYIQTGTSVTVNKYIMKPKPVIVGLPRSDIDQSAKPRTTEELNKLLDENKIIAKSDVKVERKRLIRDSVIVVKEVKHTETNSYLSIIQNARKYAEDYDWLNARKFYADAYEINKQPILLDTLNWLDAQIKFESVLDSAKQIMIKASKSYVFPDTASIDVKLAICNESKDLYYNAIYAYKYAFQMDSTSGSPKVSIRDCGTAIKKIDIEIEKFESESLYNKYNMAYEAAKIASNNKDFYAALKAYEEAFGYIQNKKLQDRIANYMGRFDYIKDRIQIMQDQISAIEAQNKKK